MQYISQLNYSPLLPVHLTVNVRRFYNSVVRHLKYVFLQIAILMQHINIYEIIERVRENHR